MSIKHLVMYSGGICSFLTAKRVVERHGKEGVVLLFADTSMEDKDLYRFLDETSEYLEIPITRLCDGRNPWEVCEDKKMIANSLIDPCSRILKRELLNEWRDKNCNPKETIVHFGIDWTEEHRLDRVRKREPEWTFEGYMTEPPRLTKPEMIKEVKSLGIKIPRLYRLGFAHNNCGGFCFKSGQAQFKLLLEKFPDLYRYHEQKEQQMAEYLYRRHGRKHSIMRKQIKNKTYKITMKEFRRLIAKDPNAFDKEDWGGCGCAMD